MNTTLHQRKQSVRPHSIVLTPRDRELFAALADYRVLTTEQMHYLFFPSLHRTRKRLHQLWQHGLVQRAVRAMPLGDGSSQLLHAIAVRGQRLLAGEGRARQMPRTNLAAFSEHSERINSLRISLTLATRMSSALSLSAWTQGPSLKMRARGWQAVGNDAVPIVPDAMFALRFRDREFTYFAEIDQGRTDLGRIAQKCAGYHRLWHEKIPQRRFGIRSFRVLYLTTARKRLVHIMQKIREQHRNSSCPDLIVGATRDAVSLSEPLKFFSMAWWTVVPSGDIVLSCLLPSPSFARSRQRPEHHLCADQNPDASCKETPGPVDEGGPRLPGSGSGQFDCETAELPPEEEK